MVPTVERDLGLRHLFGDVQQPRAEVALLRVVVLGGIIMDLVEPDVLRTPVERVLLHDEFLLGAPRLEPERAVAHVVARVRPGRARFVDLAEFEDRRKMHGIPRLVVEHPQEVSGRLLERDDQREIIRGLDAHLCEVADLALVELPCVDDLHVREACGRILRAERGQEDAALGFDEIARGDGVAVAPAGVVAQVKGVHLAVGRDVPRCGDTRDGVQVLGVLRDESLEERVEDVAFRFADDRLRVEVGGFRRRCPSKGSGAGCRRRRVRRA